MRLQKYLALCGLGSRRSCEKLIAEGRVLVDGRSVSEQGVQINPDVQQVQVDRRPVVPDRPVYVMLNKPRGVICSADDENGRRTFLDCIQNLPQRVFYAGRLDADSEGLLFLTNDGDLANGMAHPRYHLRKQYQVTFSTPPGQAVQEQWLQGVSIDGERMKMEEIRPVRDRKAQFEIILTQGRNRQIRRMAKAAGLKVKRLRRTAMGPLKLGGLRPGQWRELHPDELQQLRNAIAAKASGNHRA